MENITLPTSKPTFAKIHNSYVCPHCNSYLYKRVSRGWIVKNIFFWLAVKRYHCDKCFSYVYVKAHKHTVS